LLLAGLAVLLAPAPAGRGAAPAVAFTTLNVDIWPEHDDPRILIVYRGTLSEDAPLPYALTFVIPAAAQVHAAAYRRAGQLLTAPYQALPENGRLRVALMIPEREFQFEYYVDAIRGLTQRSFAVELALPLQAATLQVSVEQPLRATEFRVMPPAAQTATAGGLTYHLYSAQRWPADRVWSVAATYRKNDADPSLPRAAVPSGVMPVAADPGPLLWLLPAAGGILFGMAGTLVVVLVLRPRIRRTPSRPAARRRGRRSPQAAPVQHCPNCGASVGPRDRFCARCGRSLGG
jgi:hypothetical protein